MPFLSAFASGQLGNWLGNKARDAYQQVRGKPPSMRWSDTAKKWRDEVLLDNWQLQRSVPQKKGVGYDLSDLLKSVGGGGGYAAGYNLPKYKPPKEFKPKALSRKELERMAKQYAKLQISPQIQALERAIEEAQLSAEKEQGTVTTAYEKGLAELGKTVKEQHRGLADQMVRRGIYDSGEAVGESKQLDLKHQELEGEAGDRYNQIIKDIAAELSLVEKHNREQKSQLAERKGQIQSTMLDELMHKERARQDMLSQQDFDRYIALQGLAMQAQPKYYAGSGASGKSMDFENLAKQLAWQQILGGSDIDKLPTALQFAMGYDPYAFGQPRSGYGGGYGGASGGGGGVFGGYLNNAYEEWLRNQ